MMEYNYERACKAFCLYVLRAVNQRMEMMGCVCYAKQAFI